MTKRKRGFCVFLGLLISLSSVCAEKQVSEPCGWPQHLRIPGRTGYTPCNGPDSPELLWETSIEGDIDVPPLAIGDTLVMLQKNPAGFAGPPQSHSSLLEINLMTGEAKTILHEPKLYDDFFYDGTYYYVIGMHNYDTLEGEILRVDPDEEELVPVASVSMRGTALPNCHAIVLKDAIIYPSSPLTCFSRPDFDVLWSTESVLPDPETTTIDNAVANDSYVFVASTREIRKGEDIQYIHNLYCLDITTGEIRWKQPMLGTCLVLEEKTLFAGSGEAFYALDATTGQVLWESDGEGISSSNMVVGPECIFVTSHRNDESTLSYKHDVMALSKETGEVVWKSELTPLALRIFLVGGGRYLYCATSLMEPRSDVVCFDTKTGREVWSYTFKDETHYKELRTYPVLAKGILILPNYWGEIYAFATEIVDEPATPQTPKTELPSSYQPESIPPSTTPSEIVEPISQTRPPITEPPPSSLEWYYLVAVAAGISTMYIMRHRRDRQKMRKS
jgi:hypothetical protein